MGKIKPKECQNVEFKSSWNDKYLEWICGFANAQGAVMYIGVNDDHEVVGLKQSKKLLEDIPGMLPPNYSVEKLMQPHESHPRNRLMANVFYLAGFIEAWGRGYEKIRDAFKAENLEMPVFEEVRGGFMATIKREKFMAIQKGHNVTSDDPKDDPKELSERQKLMLKEMNTNDTITIQEMTQKINVSEKTIKREIALLQGMGALIREGGRKEGRWVVLIKL